MKLIPIRARLMIASQHWLRYCTTLGISQIPIRLALDGFERLKNMAKNSLKWFSLVVSRSINAFFLFCVLGVNAQPVISTQPSSQVVGWGTPVSLNPVVTGATSCQWLKDGVRLNGQTNGSLSIGSFQLTNSGNYQLVASNANGIALSLPARLSMPNVSLLAWGNNGYGQLGNGDPMGSNVVSPQAVASNVVVVAGGQYHSLFVESDGTLWAMGGNAEGELGIGTMTEQDSPVNVAGNVVAVAAGGYHSLLVKADSTLWAMGYNRDGQLGNGTTNNQDSPVYVASNVVAAAGGYLHSLFVKSDGTLWAMGHNRFGALGNGTTNNQDSPVYVASQVVAAAAGGSGFSLFIKADGTLWAMGNNGEGQLGNGDPTGTNVILSPQAVASNVVAAAAGSRHSLFVKADGTLWAMGYNAYGQLGIGTTNKQHLFQWSPTNVAGNVVAVAAGAWHSLFVKADGTLWAMGYNAQGELGIGTFEGHDLPVQIDGLSITSLGAMSTATHSLAVGGLIPGLANLTNQTVLSGQAVTFTAMVTNGTPPFSYQWQFNGTNIVNATNTTYALASVMLTNAGTYTIQVAGAGGMAAASATLTVLHPPPIIVTQPNSQVVSGGTNVSLNPVVTGAASYQWLKDGVRLNGQTNGNLSIGSFQLTNSGNYQLVAGNANGITLSLPARLSMANVLLLAWGDNDDGQLGNGDSTGRAVVSPQVVASNMVAVAAGAGHSLFIKSDGTLWAMGDNDYGQLGTGTTNKQHRYQWSPTNVASHVVAVAAAVGLPVCKVGWHALGHGLQ